MGKIKIGDIEGAKEDVIGFIMETGIDTSSYLHAPKPIKVSFLSLALFTTFLLASLCAILFVSDVRIATMLALLSVIFACVITCLVYMYWKNRTLACIVALFEVVMFALATGVYTFSDIVKKVENHIEKSK